MTDNFIVFNEEISAGYLHAIRTISGNEKYEVHILHSHDNIYEIIMLISGDLEFHVEGSIYKPKQYDVIVVRPNELHKLISCSNEPFERFTIHISADFFSKNNCKRFESVFLNRKLGTNNLITTSLAKDYIKDLFYRIEDYFVVEEYLVANSALIELLYHLNCANKELTEATVKNDRINDIIIHINDHLNENITLESLSDKFYIDKYYLCKSFKKHTSYTVTQYITYKRIILARELHKNGLSLTDASAQAGFNSYSNFYKAHIKFIGTKPRG